MQSQESSETEWRRNFFLAWLARLSFFFAFHQMQPVFPIYLGGMGASSTVIGSVMATFTITATAARAPIGLLVDRFGRKIFLNLGIILFSAATLGYAWAPSLLFIVLFRILHGIGWSGCTTAVGTLAADIAPEKRRGELIGYAGMASNVGAAMGPLVGFAMFRQFGYRGMFLTAFGTVLSSLLAAARIQEPKLGPVGPHRRQKWIEAVTVPESLLSATTAAFLSFGHAGIGAFLPLYALERGLENPGIWFALYAAGLLLSRPLAGKISDRVSRRAVVLPGFTLNLAGMILLAFAPSSFWLLASAPITGIGYGAAHATLMTETIDRASPQRRGLSMAQFQLFFDLGIGIGAVLLGGLLDITNQNFSLMYLASVTIGLIGMFRYWVKG